MGAIRLVAVLLIAGIAAIVLALLVRNMTATRPVKVVAAAPQRPMVRILVAKHDMQVGDRVVADDLGWQTFPKDAINPAFVQGGPADPKAGIAEKAQAALQVATGGDPAVQGVSGSLVREAILASEPINKRKLVKGGEGGFMAVKLPQGMRAMALPVTVETGAGGFLLPGDHVDVILNQKMTPSGDGHGPTQPVESHAVMRNLKVLAIDQTTEPKPGAAALVGAVATLEVPAEDVEELAKSKDEGVLMLVLRSYADMGGPAERATPPPAAASRVIIRAKAEDTSMRVFSGDKISEVKVP
jgi:pilus assembly protein CpaB